MSTESESFLARWSRRKREAERETERSAEAPELPAPAVTSSGDAAAVVPPSAPVSARESAPTTEVPLPPIESLDGLRSDYQAFFQQPVTDDLRRAALKKLFADPHFNKMDMLDVYVDDYTQFEPLSAAMRMRLPSARRFLTDSERAEVEAAEAAAAGDSPEPSAPELVAPRDDAADADAASPECGRTTDDAIVEVNSGMSAIGTTVPIASADDPRTPLGASSSPAVQPAKSSASDSSS